MYAVTSMCYICRLSCIDFNIVRFKIGKQLSKCVLIFEKKLYKQAEGLGEEMQWSASFH